MDGGAISCLNQSPHREESKDKDRTRLVGGNPLTARPFLPEKEYGNRLKVSCYLTRKNFQHEKRDQVGMDLPRSTEANIN